MTAALPRIAIVGGTGALGAGLALRLSRAQYPVIVGSREVDKARAAAARIRAQTGCFVDAASNRAAAGSADIIMLAVPYGAQAGVIDDIRAAATGKLVVVTTVPLASKLMQVRLPAEGSAAVCAQQLLGAPVVSAFHNVPAHKLALQGPIECDVLVFGDRIEDRASVIRLVEACRLRGLDGGSLVNSAAAEALTSVLIFINRKYGIDGAGIRITGDFQSAGARMERS